jgi:hypothetical protein
MAVSRQGPTVYTQVDADPACPSLISPGRGTGVVFYPVVSSKIIMLFQVPPLGRGLGDWFSTLLSCISTCVYTVAPGGEQLFNPSSLSLGQFQIECF